MKIIRKKDLDARLSSLEFFITRKQDTALASIKMEGLTNSLTAKIAANKRNLTSTTSKLTAYRKRVPVALRNVAKTKKADNMSNSELLNLIADELEKNEQ